MEEWDNKFGLLNPQCCWKMDKDGCGYGLPDDEQKCNFIGYEGACPKSWIKPDKTQQAGENKIMNNNKDKVVKINGVGADAEIVVNEKGGKQSRSPMAMHLVDPEFLREFAYNKVSELEYCDEGDSICVDEEDMNIYGCYRAIEKIADYMLSGIDTYLQVAMDSLNCEEIQQIISIAEVLQHGASRYAPNNWRLIPEEKHINHALIHLIAHIAGDTQDEHINHALCRLMMARATKKSDGFEYNKYVDKKGTFDFEPVTD